MFIAESSCLKWPCTHSQAGEPGSRIKTITGKSALAGSYKLLLLIKFYILLLSPFRPDISHEPEKSTIVKAGYVWGSSINIVSGNTASTGTDQNYSENWKDLFQPQSVNSALLAKVWFSPFRSHFSTIWAKLWLFQPRVGPILSPGTKSALANWTVLTLI